MEQRWEHSPRLSPMWPVFDPRTRRQFDLDTVDEEPPFGPGSVLIPICLLSVYYLFIYLLLTFGLVGTGLATKIRIYRQHGELLGFLRLTSTIFPC